MSGEGGGAATLWARLGRRKLVQWSLAHGAGVWVLLQVLGLCRNRIGMATGSHTGCNAAPPEFPAYARKLGFAELWGAYGPPGACRRIAPLDNRCD